LPESFETKLEPTGHRIALFDVLNFYLRFIKIENVIFENVRLEAPHFFIPSSESPLLLREMVFSVGMPTAENPLCGASL